MMDQPAADACAAVGMFTGRLEGSLQHVSTHTAQKTLIHVAHKPVKIIPHPAPTQTFEKRRFKKLQPCNPATVLSCLFFVFCFFTCCDSYLTSNFHSIQLFFLPSSSFHSSGCFTGDLPTYLSATAAFPSSSSFDLLLHQGEGLLSLKALPYV